MKNYSSLAENSNLTGPPGFLLAVFGNYAPSPHGRQTLERENAADPCMWSVVSVSHSSSHCFLSGLLPDAHKEQGSTFILISHARESQAQAMERQHTARHNLHTGSTREAQTPPGPPSTLKDCFT